MSARRATTNRPEPVITAPRCRIFIGGKPGVAAGPARTDRLARIVRIARRRLALPHVLPLLLSAGVGMALAENDPGTVPGHGARTGQSVELVIGTADAARGWLVSANGHQPMTLPASTPLGSLWKLFVFAYVAETGQNPPDYRCSGQNPQEEAYCCAPGESIGRDAALAKSCGLYFDPERLGLAARPWREFWQRQPQAPAWLLDLSKVQPGTVVPVTSLLAALSAITGIEGQARPQTMTALRRVLLEPRARPLLAAIGSSPRLKTWSWHDEKNRRIAGFAGWLADGTPIWLRGSGTSAQVIEKAAPWLAGWWSGAWPGLLPNARVPNVSQVPHVLHVPDDACVKVRYFSRYPLQQVLLDGQPAPAGALRGKVTAQFVNGQTLKFAADGDLSLSREGQLHPQIQGRFGLNNYVARVVQREAAVQPPAAARALAVAARTYLVRHAGLAGGCYEIDDDSRTQRVSPHAPGPAALAVAEWSDGLVLNGVAGRYHLHQPAPGQLAWRQAVQQAQTGLDWEAILRTAYGGEGFAGFGLVGDGDAGECQPLPLAENWLRERQPAWRQHLSGIPGYEAPSPLPRVCRLDHGNPYADIERGRIYATGIASPNERLTLAHEFLHFGLANHPRGRDEDYVEQTARRLLGTP